MFKKNNNFKKIIFKAQKDYVQILKSFPKPSSNVIPEWYKKQKNFSNGENNFIKSLKSEAVGTFKMCTPFVDTLTSGYLITLPADILITNVGKNGEYDPFISWRVNWPVLDSPPHETHTNYPVPNGFNNKIFRWFTDFKIETPNGYSCWIMHPSHRWDLPFITINGFVDTDKHPSSLVLPFFIQDGFVGLIKEGTPIAQVIPIKRENWKSEKQDLSPEDNFIVNNFNRINFIRTYKEKYWSRKKYE